MYCHARVSRHATSRMRSLLLVCAVAAAARPQLVATSTDRWQRTRARHDARRKLVQERPLLRWAEWPLDGQPELPETHGKFMLKNKDRMSLVLSYYFLVITVLHIPVGGIIDGRLIDKVHLQLGRWLAVVYFAAAYGYSLKALALRLLDLAIHPEDIKSVWPQILSGLPWMLLFTLGSHSKGSVSAFFSMESALIAKGLATPDQQMMLVGFGFLCAGTFEALVTDAGKLVTDAGKALGKALTIVLLFAGNRATMRATASLGHVIRSAGTVHDKNTARLVSAVAGMACILLGLGSVAVLHLVFLRPCLRCLPRPQFWPAWLPWGE